MGTRYFVYVECPICGMEEEDVYYAPTCGFVEWTCPQCGHIVDLAELTGISYEDASNRGAIKEIVQELTEHGIQILGEEQREEEIKRTEIKVISWEEYCGSRNYHDALLDLDTVPLVLKRDYSIRNTNLALGETLCLRCNGTGNELFSHYRRCQDCYGAGVRKE